jgi:hypothetical protein
MFRGAAEPEPKAYSLLASKNLGWVISAPKALENERTWGTPSSPVLRQAFGFRFPLYSVKSISVALSQWKLLQQIFEIKEL